jgi:hypothetical protein
MDGSISPKKIRITNSLTRSEFDQEIQMKQTATSFGKLVIKSNFTQINSRQNPELKYFTNFVQDKSIALEPIILEELQNNLNDFEEANLSSEFISSIYSP